ncbi:MAG: hypothetical protein HUU23_02360, partial [Caldilineales bacterium]|nr:hypothetical protein [Caldilineales bacterium]
ERTLAAGWQALSLPLIPANPALPAVLDSIAGSYDSVLWYDNSVQPGRWRRFAPGDASSDLPALHQLIGVWLHMTGPATLTVAGVAPPPVTVIPLQPGWNQIGYPSTLTQDVAALLSALTGGYDQARVWDNDLGRWLYFAPGDGASTLTHFRPGDAIWIHATRAGQVTIVN